MKRALPPYTPAELDLYNKTFAVAFVEGLRPGRTDDEAGVFAMEIAQRCIAVRRKLEKAFG